MGFHSRCIGDKIYLHSILNSPILISIQVSEYSILVLQTSIYLSDSRHHLFVNKSEALHKYIILYTWIFKARGEVERISIRKGEGGLKEREDMKHTLIGIHSQASLLLQWTIISWKLLA